MLRTAHWPTAKRRATTSTAASASSAPAPAPRSSARTLLQHFGWLLQSENGLAALGVIGLILAGLVAWGYSVFRHGGVVEEGAGLADEAKAADAMDTIQGFLDSLE